MKKTHFTSILAAHIFPLAPIGQAILIKPVDPLLEVFFFLLFAQMWLHLAVLNHQVKISQTLIWAITLANACVIALVDKHHWQDVEAFGLVMSLHIFQLLSEAKERVEQEIKTDLFNKRHGMGKYRKK